MSTRDRRIGAVAFEGGRAVLSGLSKGDPTVPLEGLELDPGDVVEVALGEGGARVLRRLAGAGTARASLYALMGRHGVDPTFSREVREETEALLEAPGFDDPALEDMRALPFVTIDNRDTRDLDQALFIERVEAGGYTLFYALADAAYYVKPGTALWREALRRGSSFYLPGVTAPMLPKALSEGLISLGPEQDRRALVFKIHLDALGHLSKPTEILRGLIHSRAKLTYVGVQELHDAPCESPLTEREYTKSLMLMREVGELRIAVAEARDVIHFNRVSPQVGFTDEAGTAFEARLSVRNEVERWNEQISLLCNMEGARFLGGAEPHVQPIYRVHPFPRPGDLEVLAERIASLVEALGLDPEVWRWDYGERGSHTSLARFIEQLPEGDRFARVRQAIERQAMIAIAPSSFTDTKGPHFGIGAEQYARFSAPMREIVGIFTHKEALEKLRGPSEPQDNAADEILREEVIRAGNTSKARQRRLTKDAHRMVMDQLFAADLRLPVSERPRRTGTVLGARATRLYVQLDAPPMEIKIYADDLAALDGGPPKLVGDKAGFERADGRRIMIGDGVELKVMGCEGPEARWRILPVGAA